MRLPTFVLEVQRRHQRQQQWQQIGKSTTQIEKNNEIFELPCFDVGT